MKEGQEEIYYLVGSGREVIEKGPFFEGFRARGLEVAFFTEAVDDYVLEGLPGIQGKETRGREPSRDRLGGPAGGSRRVKLLTEEETEGLVSWLNSALDDRVAAGRCG